MSKQVKISKADQAPRLEVINRYIEEKLTYYKAIAEPMADDRNPDRESLELKFRKLIKGNYT